MPTLPTKPDVQSRARRAGYDPEVLRDARVLVAGVGALGQNLAQDLALSGVRTLRLVDGDVFEEHNRSRSPLHPRRGRYAEGERLPKASSVGAELALLHVDDGARILVADTWIEEIGLGAFDGVDVIAACVDALDARAYLARVAMMLDIPIVDGGFSGPSLGLTVYPRGAEPPQAPCWSCGGPPVDGPFSCEHYARFAESQGVVPAIQNGAAALGALCAEAVIMVLHDREAEPRRTVVDLRTGESMVFRPRPDPVCAASHRRLPDAVPTTLTPDATAADAIAYLGEADAMLFPRDVFVERANCPGCRSTCDVGAPAHRWGRDARCTGCDGPWPRAETNVASPDTIDAGVAATGPGSALTLAELGFGAGDVVELLGSRHSAIKLAGGPEDLFREVSLAAVA